MPDTAKLTEVIIQCHKGLDEIFLLHQEAVLLGNFDDAIQLLNCFKELHHLHAAFEDEKLIPKLEKLHGRERWPASLYTLEHNKVQELMGKTENNLISLSQRQLSGRDLRRAIITLLEYEKTFKGVCEHHQEREEAGLLPELDQNTDAKWRASIIEPFLKEWSDCMEHNVNIINGINFPL